MSLNYNISEIFFSLQGEGSFTGTPVIFIRFQGCNQRCSFCYTPEALDTDTEKNFMTVDDIISAIGEYSCKHLVLTGGEPLLHIQKGELLSELKKEGYFIQIETNGTVALEEKSSKYLDWITCSPKNPDVLEECFSIRKPDEIKVLYSGQALNIYDKYKVKYLQPIDVKNDEENKINYLRTIDKLKELQNWRLSVQMHKLLNIR